MYYCQQYNLLVVLCMLLFGSVYFVLLVSRRRLLSSLLLIICCCCSCCLLFLSVNLVLILESIICTNMRAQQKRKSSRLANLKVLIMKFPWSGSTMYIHCTILHKIYNTVRPRTYYFLAYSNIGQAKKQREATSMYTRTL